VLLAPAKTPHEIVTWLEAETLKVLVRPDIKEKLYNAGFLVNPKGAKAAWARVSKEIVIFREVIDQAGIKKM
jgi:tripartite-type tricarboxylate transporter receptor subunit TctC